MKAIKLIGLKVMYWCDKITKPAFDFNCQRLLYAQNDRNKVPERTERAIEIPLIENIMSFFEVREILEIGNVLQRFGYDRHKIIDKYEEAENVENIDVIDFFPVKKFSLIILISTLEHIGFDETEKDSAKIKKTLSHLKEACLKENGLIVFTVPLNYNEVLDNLILSDELGLNNEFYFKRKDWLNEWVQTDKLAAFEMEYSKDYATANSICFAIIKKKEEK